MTLQQLLDHTISRKASDLHLVVGSQPVVRVFGELIPVNGTTPLSEREVEEMIFSIITEYQKSIFIDKWELDFGLEYQTSVRFRVNLYKTSGTFAASFRLIPSEIKTLEVLGLPPHVGKLTDVRQGLILVTGPTGHGKSTTLASFINQINSTRSAHIITVEDPIEYTYPKGKSLISQREINQDTRTWGNALRAALREDPDVVLVGEMRDLETVSSAMTIAETGHLVFATLHTNSAAQSVDRIIDVFPYSQQPQIRVQLAAVLEAIISQRLVPTMTPGRVLASEILLVNPALQTMIRESKTHQIDNLIQTSGEIGMVSMETSLAKLVKEGKVSLDIAKNYSTKPNVLSRLLGV